MTRGISRLATSGRAWFVGGALVASTLIWAAPASAACTLGAVAPVRNANQTISAKSTRGNTCAAAATVTSQLRKDVFGPDQTWTSNPVAIVNGSVTVTTNGNPGGGSYRTRATSNTGAFSESAWVNL